MKADQELMNEEARLARLKEYDILDSHPEVLFDDLVQLASSVCSAPIAAISLADADRLWFKAKVGLDRTEIPRGKTMCSFTLYESDALIIEDILKDPRFSDNSYVTDDLQVRFYAGVPLTNPEGIVLGCLCVLDRIPRQMNSDQVQALKILARQAVTLIENRHINQKLEESEEKYRVIGEAANDAILSVNEHGRIIYANPAFERIFGYSASEVLSQPLTQIMPERYRTHHEDVFMRYMFTGKRNFDWNSVDLVGLRKDGQEILLEGSLGEFYGYGTNKKIMIGILRDVTERSKERTLLEMNSRVLEGMSEGVDVLDEDGIIILSNPANDRIFGYKPGELIGQSWIDSNDCSIEESQRIESEIKSVLEKEGKYSFEFKKLRKDGTSFVAGTHITLLETEGKSYWVQVKEDITEKKRTALLIEEQRARAISTAKLSALGEMSAGIAHEINNPLAIIHGKASILRDQALDGQVNPETVIQATDKIESTVMRITKIIKALRAFARDGESDPFEPAVLALIIEDTLEFCKSRFKNLGIDLQVDTIPESLVVQCRPIQISQVFLNLLNNAFDAVQQYKNPWVRISFQDLGKNIEIRFVDCGNGIPVELREKILQPFFTTKETGKGTGLGLSISKGIIESHQGTFSIDDMNKNTCFIVRIPKVQSTSL